MYYILRKLPADERNTDGFSPGPLTAASLPPLEPSLFDQPGRAARTRYQNIDHCWQSAQPGLDLFRIVFGANHMDIGPRIHRVAGRKPFAPPQPHGVHYI